MIELASDDDDAPPPKKKHRQDTEEEDLDKEDDGPEVQLIGYAYVEKPAKPTTGHGHKAVALEYTKHGPLTFTSKTTFHELLDIIAKALPCPRNNIVVDSIQAKPEHPSTAKLQGTHNSLGFKVLVDKLIALKAHQCIGHFYMKPPMKTANNEPQYRIKKVPPAQSILIAPPSMPAPAPPAPAAPSPSMAETLMLVVLAQNSLSFGRLSTFGGFGGNASMQQAPRAVPSPVKQHKMSIEQFVVRYGLNEKDVGQLSSMDFRPGDAIKEELSNYARDAGFKTLSWGRVYVANVAFKADLKAGVLGDEP
ncbi:hypothetical protein GGX14DRAFT_558542 [Mycena pura]|uniref:Uncharacterized protein n=1 Tax=Mycena pura TaxID=153505 RepID=A0AAD6YKY9_9AGAR|nr:hypothetical protein GGX14DRAFT_558542 [Mycena pura]